MSEPVSSLKPKPPASFTPAAPPSNANAKQPAVNLDATQSLPPASYAPPKSTPPAAAPSTDPKTWPDEVLDRNALALRKSILKNPSAASASDRELLAKIEAEIQRRQANAPTGVKLCARPADLPLNPKDGSGVDHWWLKTGKVEAGMGIAGGGVPGKADGPKGYPLVKTAIVPHDGESNGPSVSCVDVPGVDASCVEDELQIGKDTGRWAPTINDCHTVVSDILKRCATTPVHPQAIIQSKEADAGVP